MAKKTNLVDILLKIFDLYPRENFVLAFFWICSFIILNTVFTYTVFNHTFYKTLADSQQLWEVIIPVNRGTIYSSTNSGTVLATSVHLYDIAIDPQMVWDKGKLAIFLRDITFKQLCQLKTTEACYNNLLKYLRVLEIPDFKKEDDYIKELLLKSIQDKLSRTKVTSDMVASEVDGEKVLKIQWLHLPWIYIDNDKIIANPEEIADESYTASTLASILLRTPEDIKKSLKKRDLRYVPIINKVNIWVSDDVKDFLAEEKDALKKWLINEEDSISNFIVLTTNPSRYYPEGSVWSQITWFVDNDGVGHYGIEWFFNEQLKWQKWKIVSRKDIQWRTIEPINTTQDEFAWIGSDIYTTIDRSVQKKVEEIIEKWVKEFRAVRGSIIVMNPFSWEITAMANYPTYDANFSSDVYELEKVSYAKYPNPTIDLLWYPVFVEDTENGEEMLYDGKKIFLRLAEREELWNIALIKYKYKNDFWAWVFQNNIVSGLYEPWSIMKALTVAIGVDTGEIKPYDMYNDEWKIEIDNFTIKNVVSNCLGYKSFQNALNYSCNVWMIRIVQKIWKALFYQYLKDFWFWKNTGITLEWETTWALTPYEKWSTAQLFTTSFWLWVNMTQLQMATAYSVLANWWYYVTPRILKSITFPNGKQVEYRTEISHRVIKESSSKTITSMLVDSIEHGVAKNWKVPWYTLAWKTWTSPIAFKGGYETGEASTNASFAGYGPAEEPKFVIVVRLERPKASIYWDTTSAHIFKRVAEYLIDYYWIPKKK